MVTYRFMTCDNYQFQRIAEQARKKQPTQIFNFYNRYNIKQQKIVNLIHNKGLQ